MQFGNSVQFLAVARPRSGINTLIGNGSQTAAVYRTLGELYGGIGLTRLAEERYLRALELSQETSDIEGQAIVQHALGLIYHHAYGNKTEAVQRLQHAIELYNKLADSNTVARIQEQLTKLQQS